MNKYIVKLILAVLAGMAISLGGVAYLTVGGPVGAFLFSFGLLTCITYKLQLYTGQAGFINNIKELPGLLVILIGNIIGCFLISQVCAISHPQIVSAADRIVEARLLAGPLKVLFLAMLCGVIMTIVVRNAHQNHWWTLLLGIPLFILCGMSHSVADAYYILLSDTELSYNIILIYIASVIGNFIGCNVYRPAQISLLTDYLNK